MNLFSNGDARLKSDIIPFFCGYDRDTPDGGVTVLSSLY